MKHFPTKKSLSIGIKDTSGAPGLWIRIGLSNESRWCGFCLSRCPIISSDRLISKGSLGQNS